MKILDLKEGKVVINAECLGIPEFNALYTRDKDKLKARAFAEISYVYYITDPNSPYANYSEDKKRSMLGQDMFKDPNYKADKQVEEAIAKYKILIDTPLLRLLRAVENKTDEFAAYLTATPVTEESLKSILEVMKQATPLVVNAANIRKEAEKEQKVKGQVRGKIDIGEYER